MALQCVCICSEERSEDRDEEDGSETLKKGREWRLPGLLYEDDIILCGESEQDLEVVMERFVDVCRRCLKVNANKIKVIVLIKEEELKCEIRVDGARLREEECLENSPGDVPLTLTRCYSCALL